MGQFSAGHAPVPQCRWPGQDRAKVGPAAIPSCGGCSRTRKLESAGSQPVTSNPHFAARTAVKPPASGILVPQLRVPGCPTQKVPGKDLLGVKLQTGAAGLQRRGSKAM